MSKSNTIYEVHYTPVLKFNVSPSKAECGRRNPLAFTNNINEVTCKNCVAVLNSKEYRMNCV